MKLCGRERVVGLDWTGHLGVLVYIQKYLGIGSKYSSQMEAACEKHNFGVSRMGLESQIRYLLIVFPLVTKHLCISLSSSVKNRY